MGEVGCAVKGVGRKGNKGLKGVEYGVFLKKFCKYFYVIGAQDRNLRLEREERVKSERYCLLLNWGLNLSWS